VLLDKISSFAQAVQPSHWKNDTSVQENEEETLPRNNPRLVIKGLEEQNLEDDIALYHGQVTHPKTQTYEETPKDTTSTSHATPC